MLILLLVLTVGLVQILLAYIVYKSSKGTSVSANNNLSLFLLFTGFWLILISLLPTPLGSTIWYSRLIFIFGLTMAFIFAKFVLSLVDNKKIGTQLSRLFIVCGFIIVLAISVSPSLINSIGFSGSSTLPIPKYGWGIYLFNAYLMVTGVIVIYKLAQTSYQNKDENLKKQMKYVALALTTFSVLIVSTNLVIPYLVGSTTSSQFAPLGVILMNLILTYSVVKYRLLDIRPFIARGVAYVISVFSIAAIYIIILLFLTKTIFQIDITSIQILFLLVFNIFIALSFQKIRNFYDKNVGKFFYRDAYNPQDVINQINSTIVNTLDLAKLLAAVSSIIEIELSVAFADFYLEPKASIEFHLAGSNPKLFASPHWRELEKNFDKSILKSVFASNDQTPANILNSMHDLHIEGVFKMTSGGDEVGYMLIGERKSGNSFSNQDKQLLEIIANEVAIAVQNALRFEEISQFNLTLQKRVDDATLELQRSNEKLKALDEAKDEFISMASHQLRTPLTSVKGYVSMVLEGDAGDINEQQKTFLDQAMLSSQRMVYLIADLLNVSRLKTGKFIIEPKPTYLPDVVETEISQLYETAKSRELTLRFKKPDTFPTINLDETKIRQVIMNFVDNAIYYTPKGGKINVMLKTTPKSVEFIVKDTGIGVPKQDQHKLFSKFYRAGNARKARPDGTGLGLFMAKKVVIAQGGAIIFETEENKGSTFGFTFPRNNA